MVVAESSLIARYGFEGDYTDSHNGHDGTAYGDPQFIDEPETHGQSIELDGNDYVELPTSVGAPTTWTLCTWARIDDWSNYDGTWNHGILMNGGSSGGGWSNGTHYLWQSTNAGDIRGRVQVNGTNYTITYPTTELGWMHLALTYDGNALRLYVNGSEVASDTSMSGDADTGVNDWCAGSAGSGENPFKGAIDDSRIYGAALTSSEVQQIYEGDIATGDVNGLQAHYNAEDYSSSSTLVDSSSNGRDATYHGTYTSDAKVGSSAMELDGTDDYAELPTGTWAFGSNSSVSIAAWVRFEKDSSQYSSKDDTQVICKFSGGSGAGLTFGWHIDYGIYANYWEGSSDMCTTGVHPELDTWHHIVVRYDGTSGEYSIVINNTVEGNTTGSWSFSVDGSENLIGKNTDSDRMYLDGQIDDFRVYNRYLADGEVNTIYDSTKSQPTSVTAAAETAAVEPVTLPEYEPELIEDGLVSRYLFEGDSLDSTDYGNDASVVGGETYTTDSHEGSEALSLDGNDDYVQFDDVSDDINDEVSFSGWFKPSSVSRGVPFSTHRSGDNRHIVFYGDNSNPCFDYFSDDTGYVRGTTDYLANEWHHVALTVDSSGNATLYVDGEIEIETTTSTGVSDSTQYSIGQEYDNSSATDFYGGLVDDFRTYNRPLSHEEVQLIESGDEGPTEVEATAELAFVTPTVTVGDYAATVTWDSNEDWMAATKDGVVVDGDELTIDGGGSGGDYTDSFEDGDAEGWTLTNGTSVTSNYAKDGVYSLHSTYDNGDGAYASTVVADGGDQPDTLQFYYQEGDSTSWGHGHRLFAADGTEVLAVATNNPQLDVWDASGWSTSVDSGTGYVKWIRIFLDFDWGNGTFSVTYEDTSTGSSATYTGFSLNADNIETFEVWNYSSEVWGSNGGNCEFWIDTLTVGGLGVSSGTATTETKPTLEAYEPDALSVAYDLGDGGIDLTVVGSPDTAESEAHSITLDGSTFWDIPWASAHDSFRTEITMDAGSSMQPRFDSLALETQTGSKSVTTDGEVVLLDASTQVGSGECGVTSFAALYSMEATAKTATRYVTETATVTASAASLSSLSATAYTEVSGEKLAEEWAGQTLQSASGGFWVVEDEILLWNDDIDNEWYDTTTLDFDTIEIDARFRSAGDSFDVQVSQGGEVLHLESFTSDDFHEEGLIRVAHDTHIEMSSPSDDPVEIRLIGAGSVNDDPIHISRVATYNTAPEDYTSSEEMALASPMSATADVVAATMFYADPSEVSVSSVEATVIRRQSAVGSAAVADVAPKQGSVFAESLPEPSPVGVSTSTIVGGPRLYLTGYGIRASASVESLSPSVTYGAIAPAQVAGVEVSSLLGSSDATVASVSPLSLTASTFEATPRTRGRSVAVPSAVSSVGVSPSLSIVTDTQPIQLRGISTLGDSKVGKDAFVSPTLVDSTPILYSTQTGTFTQSPVAAGESEGVTASVDIGAIGESTTALADVTALTASVEVGVTSGGICEVSASVNEALTDAHITATVNAETVGTGASSITATKTTSAIVDVLNVPVTPTGGDVVTATEAGVTTDVTATSARPDTYTTSTSATAPAGVDATILGEPTAYSETEGSIEDVTSTVLLDSSLAEVFGDGETVAVSALTGAASPRLTVAVLAAVGDVDSLVASVYTETDVEGAVVETSPSVLESGRTLAGRYARITKSQADSEQDGRRDARVNGSRTDATTNDGSTNVD